MTSNYTQLEEKRDEHEDEHRSGPPVVLVLHQLEEGEEVGGHVGAWNHRVGDDVKHPLLHPHSNRHHALHSPFLLAFFHLC